MAPDGSPIPGANVLALEMFSSSIGVAVAFTPSRPPIGYCCMGAPQQHLDYLATTSDGGTTWLVSGVLPADVNAAESYDVQLAFDSPDEGYVQSSEPAATVFTDDAGRSWSPLRTHGHPVAISLRGQALWIFSSSCSTSTTPPSLCSSELLTYRPGATTPVSVLPIPTEGISPTPGISSGARGATLLDRLGPNSAVVEEGVEGASSSLLLTMDGGLHWRVVDNPCDELTPTGLVAPSPTTWDLYCQLDRGMNQGRTRLATTTDAGETWTTTAEGSTRGPILGTIGDGMAGDLTLSGNGHVLWLLGAVTGVKSSLDGGVQWEIAPLGTGGYESELATAGPAGAWLPLPGQGLYHTTNGTTWNELD